jgi:hypothetical protein
LRRRDYEAEHPQLCCVSGLPERTISCGDRVWAACSIWWAMNWFLHRTDGLSTCQRGCCFCDVRTVPADDELAALTEALEDWISIPNNLFYMMAGKPNPCPSVSKPTAFQLWWESTNNSNFFKREPITLGRLHQVASEAFRAGWNALLATPSMMRTFRKPVPPENYHVGGKNEPAGCDLCQMGIPKRSQCTLPGGEHEWESGVGVAYYPCPYTIKHR